MICLAENRVESLWLVCVYPDVQWWHHGLLIPLLSRVFRWHCESVVNYPCCASVCKCLYGKYHYQRPVAYLLVSSKYSVQHGRQYCVSCKPISCFGVANNRFVAYIVLHYITDYSNNYMHADVAQPFYAVLAKFVFRMRRNCYFRASGQHFDTVLGFGDPDFVYGRGILAMGGHLPAFWLFLLHTAISELPV